MKLAEAEEKVKSGVLGSIGKCVASEIRSGFFDRKDGGGKQFSVSRHTMLVFESTPVLVKEYYPEGTTVENVSAIDDEVRCFFAPRTLSIEKGARVASGEIIPLEVGSLQSPTKGGRGT